MGSVYRIVRRSRVAPALVTAGFCIMVALPMAYFGTAYTKLIGSFVFCSTIAILSQRYALPIVLPMLLRKPFSNPRKAPHP